MPQNFKCGKRFSKLEAVFLTHLHSDHMADLPGLHFNSWLAGRSSKLKVYGPSGVELLTNGFDLAFTMDTKFRVDHHGEGAFICSRI